jgi:hypothetical protein
VTSFPSLSSTGANSTGKRYHSLIRYSY